jgi:hypothetical protein
MHPRRVLRALSAPKAEHERGQIVVIVGLSLVILVAMTGLVIDGGFAWGKQRMTQNAADAASEAGAVVLAQRLGGATPAKTDADVATAVDAAFSDNKVTKQGAYYTDVSGQLIDASGVVVASTSSAAEVGSGAIPANAAGVQAIGTQTFDTFLARAIGITQFTTNAPATAVAGYLTQVCSASSGCDVIPVTIPVTVLGCDGSNNPAPVQPPAEWPITNDPVVVPLCKNGPGNVGWLDWTPTGGGTSELIDSINNPNNPAIDLPSWQYITATGNINSKGVEDAINDNYKGKVVQIPQFDLTCDTQPSGVFTTGCPTPNVGGNGSNQWYHLPQFAAFQLCSSTIPECMSNPLGKSFSQGAYVNGNNSSVCDTGNGATACLVGRFVKFITKGTVGPGTGVNPGTNLIGVQLVK